jgi:eukaryotic-like serine/threonine-protein kinase
MSVSESRSSLVLELAEDFLKRYRQGERPALTEYINRHPDLAAEIREVFPAMAMMENIALTDEHVDRTAPLQTPTSLPFQQLGDFRLIREVGRGGMGVVFEAEQVSLGRHVALKVLPLQAREAKQRVRFEREAKAAAKLHHTNIVPVFGVGEQDGQPYYVMQFIQGLGLDAVLKELRRLPQAGETPPESAPGDDESVAAAMARSLVSGVFEETLTQGTPDDGVPDLSGRAENPSREISISSSSISLPGQSSKSGRKPTYFQSVAQIGIQVANALDYAHKQGILHRDIKPSNLLLDMRGTVWVTDFGLAKTEGQQDLTLTGDLLGTMRYMPPEAFDGKSSVQSDVYSLGLTLYELLALRPAFEERDRGKLIKQVTATEPARLDRLKRAAPRDLATIVHKAIEKDASHRYSTAGELSADLQRFIDDEPIRARRLSLHERCGRWCRRNPAIASLTAAVAGVLVAGAAISALFAIKAHDKAIEASSREDDARQQEKEARRERDLGENLLYDAQLNLAQVAWNDGQTPRRLRELLDGQLPERTRGRDLRGLEWYYWDRLSQSGRSIPSGHAQTLQLIVCSPDGRLAATLAYEGRGSGELKVWDMVAGKEVADLGRCVGEGGMPFFRGNGQLLMVIGLEWTALPAGGAQLAGFNVLAWDCEARREPSHRRIELKRSCTIDGNDQFDVSPDGRRIAMGTSDRHVRVWSLETGEELLDLKGHTNSVVNVVFSPDGSRLASGSGSLLLGEPGELKMWDTATRKELFSIPRPRNGVVELAFSPDGKRLALGGGDRGGNGDLSIVDATTGQELVNFPGQNAAVVRIAFSADGSRLATSGWLRSQVRVWDTRTGQELVNLRYTPQFFVFTADGRQIVTTGRKNTLRFWDAITPPESRSFRVCQRDVESIALSPDSHLLATSGSDTARVGKIWDTRTGEVLLRFPGNSPVFHPDGRRLAFIGSWDRSIRIWDIQTGKELYRLGIDFCLCAAMTFSPDGRWLAIAGDNSTIQLWDVNLGQVVGRCVGHTNSCNGLSFGPDSQRLVSGSRDKTARVWEIPTCQELLTFRGHDSEVAGIAFSPDGRTIASQAASVLKVWDASTGQERLVVSRAGGYRRGLTFTPDGKRVLAAEVATIKAWDVATGQVVLSLTDNAGIKTHFNLSSDGRQIFGGSMDGSVTIWDARSWTPELRTEREALGLLTILYGRQPTRAAVREQIANDSLLSEPLRRQALDLADSFGNGVAHEEGRRLFEKCHANYSTREELLAAIEKETSFQGEMRDLIRAEADFLWQSYLEQKANALVRVLAGKPLLKAELPAAIKEDRSLSDEVRQAALAYAEKWQPDAPFLINVRWAVVTQKYETPEQYRRAALIAEEACRLEPDNCEHLVTLGAAQYRAGQYREALTALTRADQASAKTGRRLDAGDLLFLAMSQHRLGQTDDAKATLARFRETWKQSDEAGDEGAPNLLSEATALINGKERMP